MGVPRNGFPKALKKLYDYLDAAIGSASPAADEGRVLYVDARKTSGGDGSSWTRAFATMAAAFAVLRDGDTIQFVGKVKEQLNAPDGIFDVSIFGATNRPRHADEFGESGATWTTPDSPTAATALLNIFHQGWFLGNFIMDGPSDAACVKLNRNALSGANEDDASHFTALGMVFANGSIGIEDSGGCHHYLLQGNEFRGLTYALRCTSTSVAVPLLNQIRDNVLMNNTNGFVSSQTQAVVEGNKFGKFTTMSLDMIANAGQGADNIVTGNYFTGDYSTAAYKGSATDNWLGNMATDVAEDEVEAWGATNALPAA